MDRVIGCFVGTMVGIFVVIFLSVFKAFSIFAIGLLALGFIVFCSYVGMWLAQPTPLEHKLKILNTEIVFKKVEAKS